MFWNHKKNQIYTWLFSFWYTHLHNILCIDIYIYICAHLLINRQAKSEINKIKNDDDDENTKPIADWSS
jgi:hypothetical protein